MRQIIDAHYEYRVSRRQHARLNEEYVYILRTLADTPWWKRWWVFRGLIRKIHSGKII